MVNKEEEEEEKQDQIALLWNAIIDLQQRVRKLERRLGSCQSEYEKVNEIKRLQLLSGKEN